MYYTLSRIMDPPECQYKEDSCYSILRMERASVFLLSVYSLARWIAGDTLRHYLARGEVLPALLCVYGDTHCLYMMSSGS